MIRILVISTVLGVVWCESTMAGVASKTARETAEYLIKHFGDEVAEETVKTLSKKISQGIARHGDEIIEVVRKVGPRCFQLINDAGKNAPEVIRLLNRHGNKAVWVVARPGKLAIFVKYGDEAAEAMIKHSGIAEPMIKKLGRPAAHALRMINSQNARRLAMMADDGSLVAVGQVDKLLAIVGKYGDNAAEFIWRHKGALAATTVAATFFADPQSFINGTRDLAAVAITPITEEVAKGIAERTNWTVVIVVLLFVFVVVLRVGWLLIKRWNRTKPGGAVVDGGRNGRVS